MSQDGIGVPAPNQANNKLFTVQVLWRNIAPVDFYSLQPVQVWATCQMEAARKAEESAASDGPEWEANWVSAARVSQDLYAHELLEHHEPEAHSYAVGFPHAPSVLNGDLEEHVDEIAASMLAEAWGPEFKEELER
jgi:hypothetical protein